MLVGDLIVSTRELGPDPCQVISWLAAAGTATTGGTLTAGTYYLQATAVTPWGESTPTNEQTIVVGGANNAITVTIGFAGGFNSSITGIKLYLGTVSGGENVYYFFPITPLASDILLILSNHAASGVPPTQNRAYLPDTDGGFTSAATLYRWLNESLKALARVTGGIQDSCGIASISGQRRYVAPGQWLRFDQCFYDGWELDLGNKGDTFRNRNITANISISLMVDAQSDTTRIELYWTPGRTSGTAQINGTVTAVSSTVPIQTVVGWLLADGYALLSDGTNNEIISYSAQTPTQLTGCIRGWSGTQPFAFISAETVITELNIELTGYRMPYVYNVGQAAVTLGVPPGWEPFLKDYMLGLFRNAEQETEEGKGLMKQATDGLEAWVKSNKPVAGPRQARMYGDFGIRGLVPGGLTGGIIIP